MISAPLSHLQKPRPGVPLEQVRPAEVAPIASSVLLYGRADLVLWIPPEN